MHVADGDLYYIADETRKRGIENLEKVCTIAFIQVKYKSLCAVNSVFAKLFSKGMFDKLFVNVINEVFYVCKLDFLF